MRCWATERLEDRFSATQLHDLYELSIGIVNASSNHSLCLRTKRVAVTNGQRKKCDAAQPPFVASASR